MRVICIILLVNKIINAGSSRTKYIDLLPEKEKEDFLEKIARRIFDEVQSKNDKPKASRELSDEQLNQHDEFVNHILKEESENLRKQANDTDTLTKDTGPITDGFSKDRKEDINHDDPYVDLTLRTDSNRNKRENQRRIFTGYPADKENSAENDNENSEQSDAQDIQVKNFKRRKDNSEEKKVGEGAETSSQTEHNVEENEKTTQSEGNMKANEITTKSNLNQNKNPSTEKIVLSTEQQTETPLDSLSKDLTENSKFVKKDDAIDTYVKTSDETTKGDSNPETSKESKETNKSVSNFVNQKHADMTSSAEATKAPQNYSSRVTRSSSFNENLEIDNKPSKDLEVKIEIDKVSTIKNNDSNVYNIEKTSATATTQAIGTDNSFNTEETYTNKNSNYETTRIEGLTTASPIENNKSIDKSKGTDNEKSEFNENNLEIKAINQLEKKIDETVSIDGKNLASNVKESLRVDFFKPNIEKKDLFFDLNTQPDENSLKEYKVYEISPDASPFVKQKLQQKRTETTEKPKTEEVPHLVPIYHYLPKNAFFNSHNVFGPDIGSDNENNSNDPHIIKKKSNVKIQTQKPPSSEQPFYVPIYNYSPKNAFYNPYNYLGVNTGEANDKDDTNMDYENDNNVPERYDDDNKDFERVYEKYDDENKDFERGYYFFNDPQSILKFDDVQELKLNKGIVDRQANQQNIPRTFNFIEMPNYNNRFNKKKEKHRVDDQNIDADYYFDTNKNRDNYFIKQLKDLNLIKDSEDQEDFHIPLINYQHKRNNDVETAIPTYVENQLNKLFLKNNKYRPNKTETTQINEIDYKLIKDIIDTVPDVDITKILLKLEKIDLQNGQKTKERNKNLDIYVSVMKDMVKEDNKGLTQYDWLGTTVDIQSAGAKLCDMVDAVKNNKDLHPSDLELLKYVVYLHSISKEDLESDMSKELRSMLLPRAKKKQGIIKKSGLLIRDWLVRMTEDQRIPDVELKEFEEFLDDIQTAFYDLHSALKHIAMITPYNNQNWFENLKQLHVDSNRKPLLEIILHLNTVRLLCLVEEAAKNGLEDDFMGYVMKHKKQVERTKEEFVFILKLLEELKSI